MLGDFGDVQESVSSGEELDEGAELSEPNDLAEIDLADLGNGRDVADNLERALQAVGVAG